MKILEKGKPEEQKEEKAWKSRVFISYCTVLRKIYSLVQEVKTMCPYCVLMRKAELKTMYFAKHDILDYEI